MRDRTRWVRMDVLFVFRQKITTLLLEGKSGKQEHYLSHVLRRRHDIRIDPGPPFPCRSVPGKEYVGWRPGAENDQRSREPAPERSGAGGTVR